MALRVNDRPSALRGVMAKRALLGGLIAASACAPLVARAADTGAAHHRRSAGVVMMIGGMTNGGNVAADSTPQVASAFAPAVSGDAGRESVVIESGRPQSDDAVRQTSSEVASRVMALSPIINEAAHVADVDSALLMAVIDVESGGNPQAVSPKGATGLMQLMPGTGARHGASDLFDSRQNIAAGARYLKALMRQFGTLPLALAAYNAGEGAVQKYRGQIPPYAETMNYVPKVIARYKWYQNASSSAGTASVQEAPNGARGGFILVGSGGTD